MTTLLKAGAASIDISPTTSQFLSGYPHVERWSTGIHDPLMSSSLYLANEESSLLIIANDLLYFTKAHAREIRTKISEKTNIPFSNILLTATHTHSGPVMAGNPLRPEKTDSIPPPPDPAYLAMVTERVVQGALEAFTSAQPAEIGFGTTDATGVGSNRRNPKGPTRPDVPLLFVRARETGTPVALLMVYSMHPTVLHQDSTLCSGDFPGLMRQYLAREHGLTMPIIYLQGTAGNQSPRHVVRANTFDEADRLGRMLGDVVLRGLPTTFTSTTILDAAFTEFDPPRRTFPTVADADASLEKARARFEELTRTGPAAEARTAEVDVFGAEHRARNARLQESGELAKLYAFYLPAEINVLRIGDVFLACWPAETFVEYNLLLKEQTPGAYAVTLSNGQLRGYIVTPEAYEEGGYEAGGAFFLPATGQGFVDLSVDMIRQLQAKRS